VSIDDDALGNFTIYAPGEAEHIISVEKFFPLLKSLECDEHGMELLFRNAYAFARAQVVWDWVNHEDDNHFIVIVGEGDCGWNKERQPYLIHNLEYDDIGNTVHLVGKPESWEAIVHTYDLTLGRVRQKPSEGLGRRSNPENMAIDLDAQAPMASELKSFGFGGKIECVECTMSGSIGVQLQVKTQYNIPISAVLLLTPQKLKAAAHLKLSLFGELSQRLEKRWPIPLPSPARIFIPKIVSIGPALDFIYSLALTEIKAQAVIEKGSRIFIEDDSLAEINILNPLASKIKGWTLDMEDIPWKLDGRISATLETFVGPTFRIETLVLGKFQLFGITRKYYYDYCHARVVITIGLTIRSRS
jgi:hypothetical protein